jgi:hypothetical protein
MAYRMKACPGILAEPPLLRERGFGAADVFEPSTAAPESCRNLGRALLSASPPLENF